MGASNSSELDNQRIAEIATEANGQFAKEFQFAFKDAVINKIKTAYLQPTVKLSLLQADTPSQTIKTGHLLKLGANIKNWKRRKFVAKNKSDNYAIIYYEDDHELKEKGRFNCCGYEVDVFSAEECGWYGQFGIKLKSHDDARRMWLFRAESEEDQRQWIEVLTNACKKAKPDIPRDAVFVEAFTTAYRVTRAAYGYFGVFSIIGTECEMLEYLTNEILSREMLDQFIVERGARSNSVARKNLMISVHHSVQKIIRPIAASTWRSCFSAADFMRASFELSVKASLRLLLDKEAEIRAALRDKMEALVEPYTSDLQIKTCMPVLQCAFGPLLEAYEAALLGLHRELRKALGGLEMYPETAAREMLRLEELIEQVGGGGGSGEEGPLAASQRLLWRMHTVDLTPEVQREVLEQSGGVSGYDLYAAAMDDLKALLQNAVHTFGKLSQPQQTAGRATITSASAPRPHAASVGQSDEATVPPAPTSSPPPVPTTPPPPVPSTPPPPVPTSPPPLALSAGAVRRPLAEVLDEVVTRLTADAKVSLQRVLTTFLLRAVESKVQENMVAPSYEVSLGAHKLVTRETQLMINLSSLGEGMVRDLVRGHIVGLMGDLAAEASSRLNMVAVQLIGDTRSSSA